ncbi:MAG: LemA family protein [Vampirovibrionales bacterium]|nr:LemA family protein [Vampirovibrionales bacterium]
MSEVSRTSGFRGPTRARHSGALAAGLVVVGVILAVLLMLGMWLGGAYNGMVTANTLVEQSGGNLDSQIKRRADLVPNLVATVKGYATHERAVFADIANARASLLSADVAKKPAEAAAANSAFNGALGRLLAIAENYPQLKADRGFIQLQDELAGTENRINYARIQFNEAVKDYNLKILTMPNALFAGMMGFTKRASFEATPQEKVAPKVEF